MFTKKSTMRLNHAVRLLIFSTIGIAEAVTLDEVLLKDMMPAGSSKCGENPQTTSITFDYTPSSSTWDSVTADKESYNFFAEMSHTDISAGRSWSYRFGSGGNIYSIRSDFGEAIPPQELEYAPWTEDVFQSVAVDLAKNANQDWFIHQAGVHEKDNLDQPFYSPSVAHFCEDNTCYFGSWGQQALIPTVHKSDLLYFNQYRNCGNGVIEYAQMFLNIHNEMVYGNPFLEYGPPVIHYLYAPWGGVRRSTLQDMHFSLADGSIGMKENDCNWPCSKMPYLQETGGYTTFSQNIPDYEQKLAFAHVHGKDPASTDVGNTWSRGPSRIHYGNTDRDFNTFAVNVRAILLPGQYYYSRQYLITDRLADMQISAQAWIDETENEMLNNYDLEGRKLEMFSGDDSIFGVAIAPSSTTGASTTSCTQGTSRCTGRSVPGTGLEPFFFITCGSSTYTGPDKYYFSAPQSTEGTYDNWTPIRSYSCSQDISAKLQWKLLGYFPVDECGSLSSAIYDEEFCVSEAPPPTSVPTPSPTPNPTTPSPTPNPTPMPTPNPTLGPTPNPSKKPTGTPTIEILVDSYSFKQEASGECLTPKKLKENSGLKIKECSTNMLQQYWSISGTGEIYNQKNWNICLTQKDTTSKLILEDCDTAPQDKSKFLYDWFDSSIWVPDAGVVLTQPNNEEEQSAVYLYEKNDGQEVYQKWKLILPNGDQVPDIPSKFRIKNDDRCMEPETIKMGSPIKVVECRNGKKQKWTSDEFGQIHPKKDISLCMQKAGQQILLDECRETGSKKTSFAYGYWDKTIRWKFNNKALTLVSGGDIKLKKRESNAKDQTWILE